MEEDEQEAAPVWETPRCAGSVGRESVALLYEFQYYGRVYDGDGQDSQWEGDGAEAGESEEDGQGDSKGQGRGVVDAGDACASGGFEVAGDGSG